MRYRSYNNAAYTVPRFLTFPEYLNGIAELYGDRPALSWFTRRQEEKTLTYIQLTDRISALRKYLVQKGYPHGTHIAVVGENSADWIIAALSIMSCGHIAVCVDIEQSDDSIVEMLHRSDSRVIFLSDTFLSICTPLLTGGEVSELILMGSRAEVPGVETIDRLYLIGTETEDPAYDPIGEDQLAEIVFTSGTTSLSKMVMLDHRAIMQNIYDTGTRVTLYDRVFVSLPFYHAYGFNCAVLNSFLRGTHLYINGDLRTTMRDLKLACPDSTLTVPLMLEAIHTQVWLTAEREGKDRALRLLMGIAKVFRALHIPFHPKTFTALRENISSSLRLVICGGAHLSREIAEEFELWDIQILQGYGITECSPLISVNCNYANKLGTVGLPMPSLEIRIADGEVCVRGPSVMRGYYKDEEGTAAAMTEDGWFKTGDIGSMDKNGFLSLSGRKKNLIVFKNGKKISPENLETMINAIPMVKEVVVSGAANGIFADDVKLTACIYPDPERTQGMSSYEILEQLQREVDGINRTLPSYQQIQLVNIRTTEFDKTGTRKIKRGAN